ncbi:MAG: hypothetical protein K2K65_01695, partial [Duncaniella sp.]|nr:hypothetical protein [Duncaniella sp.]
MKKITSIILGLMCTSAIAVASSADSRVVAAPGAEGSARYAPGGRDEVSFTRNFDDRTLRVDYIFSATPGGERTVCLAGQSSTDGWAGRRRRLAQLPLQGNGTVTVCSEATGDTLYRTSFSSLYHEWLTTDEAAATPKAFEHSVLLPFPKAPAIISIDLLNNRHEPMAAMSYRFDPTDILIEKKGRGKMAPHRYIHKGGNPKDAIDVAILAEGYTREEM